MGKNVLKLATRKKIYDTIREQPGICIRELERTLEMAMGELTYHLPILLKSGVIEEEKDKYFRRFYLSDFSKRDRLIISLLRRDVVKRVVPILLNHQKISNKILREELKISKSTAHWHLERLINIGLIVKQEGDKIITFSLKDREAVRKIYFV
jgi:predicted transcriptional regulator